MKITQNTTQYKNGSLHRVMLARIILTLTAVSSNHYKLTLVQ
ncbi:hypothetical protein Vc3S01_A0407 [Vibrio campbellii]|nr:hypothetical protein Vc3S01_A0407 [Vibrio campbellii]